MRRPSGTDGAMPAGALVAVCLVLAALVGIGVGAVWGQSGRGGQATSAPPTSTSAPSSNAPVSPSSTAPSDEPAPAPEGSTTSAPPAAGGTIPPAPDTTTTSADGWRLGSWRITNAGGVLGVDTTARNTSTGVRSADLVLYVYVDGVPIATTTARVTDVPAGGSVPVQFTGTDPWKPGQKVLLLQVG